MTEWSPGTAPTTTWDQEAGMAPSDPGTETNLTTLVYRAETAATNAETAETNAETAETNAETAQTAAETAKTGAETAQTAAEAAQTAAETAETNASTSATAAASSATTAQTAQTAAETAQTAAETAQTGAETAETNAETAQAAAESAQSAAESARDSALAAYDNFDDRYLGAKASNPTVDNDGDALVAGALYFNTVSEEMRLYTGSAWVAAYVSGAGSLAASNNLSDLDNVATARTNLGVEIGTDVQAYSSVLAATTASFTTADETKLDGIEASADVTDATNVAAAGAVMDGDFIANGLMSRTGAGIYTSVTDNSTNWNTAYGWGDHSTAGYLTSFTETNDLSTAVTWANVPDANITQTSVTQHQAALSITESQISDLQSYITGNQTITLSGDATGSGTTAITVSLANNTVGVDELNLIDGTNGQVLTTDGAGTISFQDAASGGASAGFAIAMAIAL